MGSKLASLLQPGDLVRIVCPSSPLSKLDQEKIRQIKDGFSALSLKVDFSKNCFKVNASSNDKLEDLHSAFADPDVRAIFAGTGGFNSNQLIDQIDYALIKNQPKIFCGYSDITVLLNAIYAKTGLITYHGPNAGGVGSNSGFEYTQDYLSKALFSRRVYDIETSKIWFNKDYTTPDRSESAHKNTGYWLLNPAGIVEGRLVGGNLTGFLLLNAGGFMPKLKGSIVLIEDDYETNAHHFDAKLEALTQLPNFKKIEGLIIGRFQPQSEIDKPTLLKIISSKPELSEIPILANVDFGHTKPQAIFPIGGIAQLRVLKDSCLFKIIEH